MPLRAFEIRPGCVAYLDSAILNSNDAVQKPASPTPRRGEGKKLDPFLCLQVSGAISSWTSLTSIHHRARLRLEQKWCIDGNDVWRGAATYTNAETYIGPTSVFVQAGTREIRFTDNPRPKVSRDGMLAVIEYMRSCDADLIDGDGAATAALSPHAKA